MPTDDSFSETYSETKKWLDEITPIRRNEMFEHLKSNDSYYSNLVKKRELQSMELYEVLSDNTAIFEKYMDLVYEQEIYELDSFYKIAFLDCVFVYSTLLKNMNPPKNSAD